MFRSQLCVLIGCATWVLASSQCAQSCLDMAFENAGCAGSGTWACACKIDSFHEQANACLTQCDEDKSLLNMGCTNEGETMMPHGRWILQLRSLFKSSGTLKVIRRSRADKQPGLPDINVKTSSARFVSSVTTREPSVPPTQGSTSILTGSTSASASPSITTSTVIVTSTSTSTSLTPSETSESTSTKASVSVSSTSTASASISTQVASTPPSAITSTPLPSPSANGSVAVTTLTIISPPSTASLSVASGSIQQLPTGGNIPSGEKETRVQGLLWFLVIAVAGLMV